MFNLKSFIKTNIINGIKKGSFAKEYGNIMAVNYLAKGLLAEEDVAMIDAEITAWEEAQYIVPEPPVEEPIEDVPNEEPTEIEDETVLDGEEETETEVEESQTETEIIEETQEPIEEPETTE